MFAGLQHIASQLPLDCMQDQGVSLAVFLLSVSTAAGSAARRWWRRSRLCAAGTAPPRAATFVGPSHTYRRTAAEYTEGSASERARPLAPIDDATEIHTR